LVALTIAGGAAGQAPGSLDMTFGGGAGLVHFQMGTVSSSTGQLHLAADGKIVVGGACAAGFGHDFCVARLTADGVLDPSFGVAGRAELLDGRVWNASGLAVQSDGAVLLAGGCWSGDRFVACIARLKANGVLDSSFVGPEGTGNGRFYLPPISSFNDYASSIVQQPDGKILIGGSCRNPGEAVLFCVTRLLPTGALDPSFSGPGGNWNGTFPLPMLDTSASLTAVLLLPDGRILLAGTCNHQLHDDFCIARLHPNGSVDTTFGTAGQLAVHMLGDYDFGTHIDLQADGKIVLAGYCDNGGFNEICLTRLHGGDGSLDLSFNKTGRVIPAQQAPVASRIVSALKVQPDGKILTVGSCTLPDRSGSCAARLNPDGSFDTTFGVDGWSYWEPGYARAAALLPDGRILFSSGCRFDSLDVYCVGRLLGGTSAAQNCKPDIDGDGSFSATTDALIFTRVALGLRGPAVISGISFPAKATRNTWPLVRHYLVSQCGLNLY